MRSCRRSLLLCAVLLFAPGLAPAQAAPEQPPAAPAAPQPAPAAPAPLQPPAADAPRPAAPAPLQPPAADAPRPAAPAPLQPPAADAPRPAAPAPLQPPAADAPRPAAPAAREDDAARPLARGEAIVYVGTYTENTESEGIYAFRMDLASGELESLGLAAKCENPSFLELDARGEHLYAVNELTDYEGRPTGAVSGFRVLPYSRRLQLLSIYDSHGGAPCHLTLDRTGRHVLVANYVGGSVASLAVRRDGGLTNATHVVLHSGSSVDPQRQTAPHAHSIHVTPDNRFAVAADLGADKLFVYGFDARTGLLEPHHDVALPPGSGPRHMTFARGELLVINELAATITRLTYSPPQCELEPVQTVSTLPEGYEGRRSTAEIAAHPSQPFVYGSNRGHDSIAVLRSGRQGLQLVEIEKTGGQEPRNFVIGPRGNFLLAGNQKSNTIHVFRINLRTGELDPTGHFVETPSPVCIRVRETKFRDEPPPAKRVGPRPRSNSVRVLRPLRP